MSDAEKELAMYQGAEVAFVELMASLSKKKRQAFAPHAAVIMGMCVEAVVACQDAVTEEKHPGFFAKATPASCETSEPIPAEVEKIDASADGDGAVAVEIPA